MSIVESSKVKHRFSPPVRESYDDGLVISIIIDCYHGLNYIKESIGSVLRQEYNNVELMLIDNGADVEISKYLAYVHSNNKNTALVTFKENQFSWNDREKTVAICWNAGLIHCKGEIVSHLSYDDMFSKNYAGKMAKLRYTIHRSKICRWQTGEPSIYHRTPQWRGHPQPPEFLRPNRL